MVKYIDQEKIAAEVRELSTHLLNEWDTMGVLALIDRQPAADVAEVRHGRWVRSVLVGKYYCSYCGKTTKDRRAEIRNIDGKMVICLPRYCGNCGAKMDERSEDEGDE